MASSVLFAFVVQSKARRGSGWAWSGMTQPGGSTLANIKATDTSDVIKLVTERVISRAN